MRLRHAAALALVGWYLMVPPFQRGGVNLDAPLRSWRLFGSYDTAKDCEDDHLEMVEKSKHAAPSGHLIIELAQCIASDDLRLKENRR
jgi:hypothetical protein